MNSDGRLVLKILPSDIEIWLATQIKKKNLYSCLYPGVNSFFRSYKTYTITLFFIYAFVYCFKRSSIVWFLSGLINTLNRVERFRIINTGINLLYSYRYSNDYLAYRPFYTGNVDWLIFYTFINNLLFIFISLSISSCTTLHHC